MSRSCASAAMVVGGAHRLPEDPCEYNPEAGNGPGCNQLRCETCGARVRNSAPGFRVKDSMRREDAAALYAAADWSASPLVQAAHASWRLYACKCEYWEEGATHYVVNDHDSPGEPDMRWVCAGHPVPKLPMTLGELAISTTTDWPALVKRVLGGVCPRPLDRKDEGPWLWLAWLYAYLEGLPLAANLSRAVAGRIADSDEVVVATALTFFRRFPRADGIAQVLARAKSHLDAVIVERDVPGRDYGTSFWDVLIGVLQQRTDEHPARDAVDLMRAVLLHPTNGHDPLVDTLQNSWTANAFHLDDVAWMAEHIVALEAAGHGRWKPIMNLVVAFASNNLPELEHLIVIAGVAVIQSHRVPEADIRAWIKQRSYKSDAWALVLEGSLAKAS